jgi:hypothetical protein
MIYENPIVAAGRVERAAKAQAFANYAIAFGLAKGMDLTAQKIFEKRWPRSVHLDAVRLQTKAAVAPMDTIGGNTSSLAPLKPLADAFVDYLRPLTVIGRMQGFRSLPLNVRVGRATAGSSVGWTGQGVTSILGTLNFDSIIFKTSKVTGIVVFTKELAKLADPSAEALIRQDLADATAQFTDQQFLDPTVAEVTDISPASITNGAPEVTSTGAS